VFSALHHLFRTFQFDGAETPEQASEKQVINEPEPFQEVIVVVGLR